MATKKQTNKTTTQTRGTNKTTNKVDILFVIPLREELQNIQKVFSSNWRRKLIGSEVYFFTKVDGGITVAAIRLKEMGNQPALEQTTNAINIVNPKAVFCIGLGGSLHPKDLKLGDVAISRAVSEIADAAKISSLATKKSDEPAKEKTEISAEKKDIQQKSDSAGDPAANFTTAEAGGGYYLELMNRQFEASVKLLNVISNLPSLRADLFEAWQEESSIVKNNVLRESLLNLKSSSQGEPAQKGPEIWKTIRERPEFDDCHFASGLVVASSHLKLRVSDREYKVIETEGAGVARACTHRELPVPFVIFRGISDLADENKSSTETGSKIWPEGMWRRIAAKNVARFVKTILKLPMMKKALLEPDLVDVTDIREKVNELSRSGKLRFQGVDLLNVLPLMSGILSQSKTPEDLYISAGDLWIARPLLTHRGTEREPWYPIKNVYIVTIKPLLIKKLTDLITKKTVQALVPNIKALHEFLIALPETSNQAKCKLHHAYWESLPPFHGYIFGEYIWHGRWGVGDDGRVQMQHGDVSILRQDAFPEEYDRVKRLLPGKNEFRLVDDNHIAKLEKEYGAL